MEVVLLKYNLPVILLKGLISLPDQEIKLGFALAFKTTFGTLKETARKSHKEHLVRQSTFQKLINDKNFGGWVSKAQSLRSHESAKLMTDFIGLQGRALQRYFETEGVTNETLSKLEDIVFKGEGNNDDIAKLKEYVKNNPEGASKLLEFLDNPVYEEDPAFAKDQILYAIDLASRS